MHNYILDLAAIPCRGSGDPLRGRPSLQSQLICKHDSNREPSGVQHQVRLDDCDDKGDAEVRHDG